MESESEKMPTVVQPSDIEVAPPSPMQMAQSFLAAGGDLDHLEKMMDLEDRHEEKKAKKTFFAAMTKAQKEMPVIYEGRSNSQTRSKYAAYKDIVRDSKPIYTKFGLAVSFYEEDSSKDDYIKLCADVYHEDGHCQTYHGNFPIDDKGPKGAPVKTKIHGIKSAISYGRGILLCNIFNIPTNEDIDDDGNAAGIKFITTDQAIEITDMLAETNGNALMFLKNFNANSVETIPATQYHRALNLLKAKAGAA